MAPRLLCTKLVAQRSGRRPCLADRYTACRQADEDIHNPSLALSTEALSQKYSNRDRVCDHTAIARTKRLWLPKTTRWSTPGLLIRRGVAPTERTRALPGRSSSQRPPATRRWTDWRPARTRCTATREHLNADRSCRVTLSQCVDPTARGFRNGGMEFGMGPRLSCRERDRRESAQTLTKCDREASHSRSMT